MRPLWHTRGWEHCTGRVIPHAPGLPLAPLCPFEKVRGCRIAAVLRGWGLWGASARPAGCPAGRAGVQPAPAQHKNLMLAHASAAHDWERNRPGEHCSRDVRNSIPRQDQVREGGGEAEAFLGAAWVSPSVGTSAFNNLQYKRLGEIKATHSWGGLSTGLELRPHMDTPPVWMSILGTAARRQSHLLCRSHPAGTAPVGIAPSVNTGQEPGLCRDLALCYVLMGFRRANSAGGRFGLCLVRLPLPTEVVRPRSRAQTLGQWPPWPPAVSHMLTSCRRVNREPAGLSASRESQPQPRKHPAHTSHPLSDHCRPNHSTQGGWLQEHGELDPKSTSREQPGTPCAWEPPCKPGGSRGRQLLALPLQWPFGVLVGRRRWRSLVQELCCMAAFARKCILILPLALRVISCSSHGGTRHRCSKPHRAAELTSNRKAACETSRVIFAVNKNTHPHATQRFKSCL